MFCRSDAAQMVAISSPMLVADMTIGTDAEAASTIPVLVKPSPRAPAMVRGIPTRPGLPSGSWPGWVTGQESVGWMCVSGKSAIAVMMNPYVGVLKSVSVVCCDEIAVMVLRDVGVCSQAHFEDVVAVGGQDGVGGVVTRSARGVLCQVIGQLHRLWPKGAGCRSRWWRIVRLLAAD